MDNSRAISRNPIANVLTICVFLVLSACGGGGSSSNDTTNSTPTVDAGSDQTVTQGDTVELSATATDDGSVSFTWSQTSGTDVTLSSTSTETTSFTAPTVAGSDTLIFEVSVDDGVNTAVTDTTTVTVNETNEQSVAFLSFSSATVTVVLDGNEVVLEATGRPDHTSCYWNPNNASGLYVDCDPAITDTNQMSPGFIENYNNLYTLRVPVNPTIGGSSTATTLGAVGIAVSGAPIFNDQEGGNVDLEIGVIQGFDRNGAHTGPETYHYHLEPRAITNDDSELVGIIADGFFLYGRKCYSTGDYPSDLDNSGGHTEITQHTGTLAGDEEYHYHIKNEFYLGAYYLLFPEDYQGTPNNISN